MLFLTTLTLNIVLHWIKLIQQLGFPISGNAPHTFKSGLFWLVNESHPSPLPHTVCSWICLLLNVETYALSMHRNTNQWDKQLYCLLCCFRWKYFTVAHVTHCCEVVSIKYKAAMTWNTFTSTCCSYCTQNCSCIVSKHRLDFILSVDSWSVKTLPDLHLYENLLYTELFHWVLSCEERRKQTFIAISLWEEQIASTATWYFLSISMNLEIVSVLPSSTADTHRTPWEATLPFCSTLSGCHVVYLSGTAGLGPKGFVAETWTFNEETWTWQNQGEPKRIHSTADDLKLRNWKPDTCIHWG